MPADLQISKQAKVNRCVRIGTGRFTFQRRFHAGYHGGPHGRRVSLCSWVARRFAALRRAARTSEGPQRPRILIAATGELSCPPLRWPPRAKQAVPRPTLPPSRHGNTAPGPRATMPLLALPFKLWANSFAKPSTSEQGRRYWMWLQGTVTRLWQRRVGGAMSLPLTTY